MILFGQQEIVVIATPGHTPGSVCYLWQDRLFTGDTLLIGGCGRTDFQNGSAEALWHSVTEKLFRLDEQTLVYPGHDYKGRRVSSIGEERQFNPRFLDQSRKQFIDLMANLNLAMPKRIHEAVPANREGGSAPIVPFAFEAASPEDVLNISATELERLMRDRRVQLIDVRTPGEFEALRVSGSLNVPLDRLEAEQLTRLRREEPLYCICQTGTRSQIAARRLRSAGFPHVVHVDGGTNAWTAAGLPVERAGVRAGGTG